MLPKPTDRKFKKKVFEDLINTGQFIYQIGESEILRKPSKRVPAKSITTPEFKSKVSYAKSCLRKYRKLTGMGRGIAAPQVGIAERFFVIWVNDKPEIFINPNITKESNEKYLYPEVCMSAAPLLAPVVRPAWIEFEYLNEKGEKKIWNTKDDTKSGRMLNRVFEHEIDHLEGIINIDRVSPKELIFDLDPAKKKLSKFKKV